MIYYDGKILARKDLESHSLSFPMLLETDLSYDRLMFLFALDSTAFYAIKEDLLGQTQDGNTSTGALLAEKLPMYSFISRQEVRDYDPLNKHLAYAAFTAFHLLDWYENTRFCGKCGTVLSIDTEERAMFCPSCQKKIYPRINPAVIVGVVNQDRILISKYKRNYAHNALIAGFTEIGETVEETVHREVMEETGLKVKNLKFYKSQPWGMAGEILMGFYCEVDGDDTIKPDGKELKFASWLRPEEIQLQPQAYSLTNEMMCNFKEGRIDTVFPR